MTKLHDLAAAGTSPWLDNIRRGWLKSGEFKRMVDGGARRDLEPDDLPEGDRRQLGLRRGRSRRSRRRLGRGRVLRARIEDVREAADQIRPVYDDPGHLDGSCRSSSRRRWPTTRRPRSPRRLSSSGASAAPTSTSRSPGTAEGVPAIEETIAAGINVNVTLLFSLGQYEAIHMAYIRGLERRLAAHQPIADVTRWRASSSRASTPRSTRCCPRARRFAAGGGRERQARLSALRRDRGVRPVAKLAEEGATVQRTLWASTGTKNPEYSDVLYVDELIGPDCVNTMPEGTIAAFQDHGTVARTVDADVEPRAQTIDALAARRRVARRRHPQARGGRREVVLGLVRFADRDDPAESRRAARRLMATTAKRPAPNPLRAGLRVGGASEPTVFVIYGGVGRPLPAKLLPAIYNLAVRGLLPSRFALIGYSRSRDGQRELPRVRPHRGREVLANAGRRPPLAGVRREPALPVGETSTRRDSGSSASASRRSTRPMARVGTGSTTCRRRRASSR